VNDQAWTIQRLLTWTAEFFQEKGQDSPRLSAEILLAHSLQCQRIDLYTRFDEIVGDEVKAQFRTLVKRHAGGEPVAYLVGQREFYSLPFAVTADVLIPRPETEHLVSETLDRIQPPEGTQWQICDVGTGSGSVAICLAKYLPQAHLTAIELSPAALQIAQSNAQRHGVAQRIRFVQGNLLHDVNGQSFHAIVSNPPYISQAEMEQVPESVKNFEPHLALLGGGSDGGQITRELIDQAADRLLPQGWLLLETSPMLAQQLLEYLRGQPGWVDSGVVKDSAGLDRILWARRG